MKTIQFLPETMFLSLIGCVLFCAGCSLTHEVGYGPSRMHPKEIGPYLEGREVTVELRHWGHAWGTVTGVTAETLYLAGQGYHSRERLPLNDILTIEAKAGSSWGPIVGGALGALAGGIIGYQIAHKAAEDDVTLTTLKNALEPSSSAAGVVIGVIAGSVAGYAVGSNTPAARTFAFPVDSLGMVPVKRQTSLNP